MDTRQRQKILMCVCLSAGSLFFARGVVYPADTLLAAGFRGSKIWNYSTAYWTRVADSMSHNFTSPARPAAVWIVTFYGSNGDIYATFPSGGTSLPHVSFSSADYNESYLTAFDQRGMHVWLQVEPGAASIVDLINIILTRYKHHPCVVGFGIDVEWLDTQAYPGGRRPSDAEAAGWEAAVTSHDSSYSFFLKHYSQNRMPVSYRGDIMFVDDSQQFTSFTACINEFKAWGNSFSSNKVGFQFGYPDDRPWWSTLANPPAAIGNALLANVPNTAALLWVDFTITEVFPLSIASVGPVSVAERFLLEQNYPNPFNPTTEIRYEIPWIGEEESGTTTVQLVVYDVLGRKVRTLVDEHQRPGSHVVRFSGHGLASGLYYYRLTAGGSTMTRTMVLIR